jgi:hypothetical protein
VSNVAARSAITMVGIDEVLRAFRNLPREVSDDIRQASTEIAERVASDVRSQGDKQAAPLTGSTRAVRDRVPSIKFGYQRKSGLSGGARINDLMGANFGASSHSAPGGFPPKVSPDYYVYRTIKSRNAWIVEAWLDAIAHACKKIDPSFSTGR